MHTLTFHPFDNSADAIHSFFAYDPYIEHFWLPVLGPTATLLMNELSLRSLTERSPFAFSPIELSTRVGTGLRSGTSSPVYKQLTRLCQVGVLLRRGETQYLVPRCISPLPKVLTYKLTQKDRNLHEQWLQRLSISPVSTQRRRIRFLVTRLEMMGASASTISTALLSTGLHPSIIGSAIASYIDSPTSHRGSAA